MSWLHGLVLGVVQGLTEFFPVSSSGHLVLIPKFFQWSDQGLAFDTVLHLGTLVALFWGFRAELGGFLKRSVTKDPHGSKARRFLWMCLVASIPSLVLGFLFGSWIEEHTRSIGWIQINLMVFGALLWVADRYASKHEARSVGALDDMRWSQALVIGFIQPLAFIPGTSRSGVTITSGLFSGLDRTTATKFSFFLGMVATGAAGAYGLLKLWKNGITAGEGTALVVGFLAAAITGAWAIRFLLSYVAKKRYDVFVYYRVALAVLLFLLF